MSTINSKNVQVGTSGVAAQNFTLYQPATPDGTVRLGVGNSGATTGDVVTVNSAGVTVTGTLTATTLSGSLGAATATSLTVNGNNISAVNSLGFRNRIINGDMRIDQRNAGASVATTTTAAGVYTLDRWAYQVSAASKFTVQQNSASVTPPAGFTNYLGCVSSSAYSVGTNDYFAIQQRLEGYNTSDLAWGTANAQTVTISFWVRSSLTGTFGGAVRNSSGGRYYLFSYTISAANTWEYKTVTVAGDTTGTYQTTNSISFEVWWSLGAGSGLSGTAGSWSTTNQTQPTGSTSVVGTNGATFYITGVQLEAGTVATPFERRDYGRELMMCQRYFLKTFDQSVALAQNAGRNGSLRAYAWTTSANTVPIGITWQYPVEMRAAPTITTYNPNNTNSSWRNNGNTGDAGAATAEIGTRNALLYINATLGATDSFVIQASATAEL